jgi:hypothetical protein
MKNKWLLLFAYICLGFLIEVFNEWIGSTYLSDLYKIPFFAVLVTMTVFSFTMFSYIAGKMSELELKYGISFKDTRKELKGAFQILVFLDIIFVVCLILRFSQLSTQPVSYFLLMSVLNILFIFVIHILIDLGMTIFKMFDTVGRFRDYNDINN